MSDENSKPAVEAMVMKSGYVCIKESELKALKDEVDKLKKHPFVYRETREAQLTKAREVLDRWLQWYPDDNISLPEILQKIKDDTKQTLKDMEEVK